MKNTFLPDTNLSQIYRRPLHCYLDNISILVAQIVNLFSIGLYSKFHHFFLHITGSYPSHY